MSVVESRLAAILDQMPKEGIKAAVAQGIVERIREIVENVNKAVGLIECVGTAKGSCKERFCNPVCGRIFLIKDGDRTIIAKYRSNAVGIVLESGMTKISTKISKLVVNQDGSVFASISGIDETVKLNDIEDVYEKSYILKRVIREVGGKVDVIIRDLQTCAKQMALVC